MKYDKVPPAGTLAQQIAAVKTMVETNQRSHTHLIGRHKGRIPPGPLRDETAALAAAVETLQMLAKVEDKLNKGMPTMRIVSADFITKMEAQLQANRYKGEWKKWRPQAMELIEKLVKHEVILAQALRGKIPKGVSKHATALANYAMKADELFGTK